MFQELLNREESQLTLYGVGMDSPVFLDLDEYKNFPEDGIVGPVGERCYLRYGEIDTIDYLGDFDGRADVFKKTSKDGEVTYYCLDFSDSFPEVIEGEMREGKVSWHFSYLESLWYTYKGFRERGITFTYDYYGIRDEENRAREIRSLLQMGLLKDRQALLEKCYGGNVSLNILEPQHQDESSTPTTKGVVAFIRKLVKKEDK